MSLFSAFFALGSNPLRGEDSNPDLKRRLALGVTYLGGDIHVGFMKTWAAELRYFQDKATSDNGDIKSTVISGRILRSFRTEKHLQSYVGLEGGIVSAKLKDSSSLGSYAFPDQYDTSGYAFGAYAGVEYYILRRLSISLDLGPTYIQLKEKSSGTSESGLDFILNSSVHFYIF